MRPSREADMGRPKRQRPARRASEAEEKVEIMRQQIRDAACGDMVLLWVFERRHFVWVDVTEALALCLAGRASVEDPPGRRPILGWSPSVRPPRKYDSRMEPRIVNGWSPEP